jgi:uncharacterized caspase-like protein/WD40 repeat protein
MIRVIAALLVCAGSWAGLNAQDQPYVKQLRSSGLFNSEVARSATLASPPLIAMTSLSKDLVVLNGSSFDQVFSYSQLPNTLSALFFTAEGSLVSARIDGQLNYWDPLKGTMTRSLTAHNRGILECVQNVYGQLVIAGSDNTVKLYDPIKGSDVASVNLDPELLTSLAIHPNGKIVAVGLASNKIVIFDSSLMPTQVVIELREIPVTLKFSSDGRLLASGGSNGTVRLIESSAWTPVASESVQRGPISSLAFDPAGRWVVATSPDSSLVFYNLRDLRTAKSLHGQGSVFTTVGFLSMETMITGSSTGTVAFWRVLNRPPDTTAPTLTILRPARYTEDAPSKIYAKQYDVLGVVYDENRIDKVVVGGVTATLTDSRQSNALGEIGLKGKEFQASVQLAAVGINRIEVEAKDSAGNVAAQTLFIRRLAANEAVEILAPAENAETEHVAMEVEIKPWFDVASYSISVNTVDLVDHRSGVRVRTGDVIREEVPLIVGYNQIGVTLVSKGGERFTKLVGVNRKFSAAITEAVRRPDAGAAKGLGPQRWAVIVGVSEYANKGIPSLKYADRDAEALAAFLQTPEGGAFDADHMRILINKDATLPNLREAMIDFLQQAIDKDLVVIYFAGHGAPDPTRPQNLYLLTYDADPNRLGTTAFPMWDIQTVISRQIAAKKVVVLSDACHSGGISVDVATRGLDVTQSNPINQYLAELARAKEGMVVFTASAAGEVSQEFPELGHGVFTYYLLEGLKGAADLNNDYLVTVNELMAYVEEQVKRKTRGAQNPTRSQTTYDKELPMAVLNK